MKRVRLERDPTKIWPFIIATKDSDGNAREVETDVGLPTHVIGSIGAYTPLPWKINYEDVIEYIDKYAEPVLPPDTTVAIVDITDSEKMYDNYINTYADVHLETNRPLNRANYTAMLNIPQKLKYIVIIEEDISFSGITYPPLWIAYEDETQSNPTPTVYDYIVDNIVGKNRKIYVYPVDDTKRVVAISLVADGGLKYQAKVYAIYMYTATDTSLIDSINSKLDVNLSTRASESTLSSIDGKITKCDTDNIAGTVAIGGVTDVKDVKTHSNVFGSAPAGSTTYQMSFSLTGFSKGRVYIKADQVLDVAIQVSFDGGTTWDDVDGLEIPNTSFNTTKANFIDLDGFMEFRVKYTTGSTPPTEVYVMLIKKA